MKKHDYLNSVNAVEFPAKLFFSKKVKRINEAALIFAVAGCIVAIIITAITW